MRTYDLIVIGAGMAGVAAAAKCAWQGWSAAIIDELPCGGTCVLRGCDPKKILRRGAEMGPGGQRRAHPARLGEVHRPEPPRDRRHSSRRGALPDRHRRASPPDATTGY